MRPALRDILLADRFYPGAYFAADFTKRKYRLGGQRYSRFLDIPGASFTRASTGYALNALGRLVNYASGDLRQVDDRGLLVEGARTNLHTQSQALDHADWAKNEATASADQTAAPDGTTTADKIIPSTNSSALHRVKQAAAAVSAGATVTESIYLKAAGYNFVLFRLGNSGESAAFQVEVNLSAGTLGTASAYGAGATVAASAIEALANGWYRVQITGAVSGLTAYAASIYVYNATGAPTYAGDGTSGVYAWGAQQEAATGASSYIPTTTASATRAADVAAITGVSIPYPCTLFAQYTRVLTDTSANKFILQVDAGSTADRSYLWINTGDQAVLGVDAGSVGQAAIAVSGVVPLNSRIKHAGYVDTNDANAARAGTLGSQDTGVTLPATATAIRLGSNSSGTVQGFVYLEAVAIYANQSRGASGIQALTA